MLAKRISGSYQPAKPYFPERNLRKEAGDLVTFFAKSIDGIRASKSKNMPSSSKTNYSEGRFISQIVERIFA